MSGGCNNKYTCVNATTTATDTKKEKENINKIIADDECVCQHTTDSHEKNF